MTKKQQQKLKVAYACMLKCIAEYEDLVAQIQTNEIHYKVELFLDSRANANNQIHHSEIVKVVGEEEARRLLKLSEQIADSLFGIEGKDEGFSDLKPNQIQFVYKSGEVYAFYKEI